MLKKWLAGVFTNYRIFLSFLWLYDLFWALSSARIQIELAVSALTQTKVDIRTPPTFFSKVVTCSSRQLILRSFKHFMACSSSVSCLTKMVTSQIILSKRPAALFLTSESAENSFPFFVVFFPLLLQRKTQFRVNNTPKLDNSNCSCVYTRFRSCT